jgi:hypothetical protein
MSVPRSFPADQHAFLVKFLAYVQRLGGNIRGDNRAVRHSEMSAFHGKEAARQLADGEVTTKKIADNAVTGKKIEQGAITEREIRAGAVGVAALAAYGITGDKIATGAVTGDKIADASVSMSKLAPGIAVSFVSGTATDGETVRVPGKWISPPVVGITSFFLSEGVVGALGLREADEPGIWEFDAAGTFHGLAIGCQSPED